MIYESKSDEEVLVTQNCFSQEILEAKSYTDFIPDEIEDIVEFETGNFWAEDLNEKVVEQNVQQKLIEPCKAWRVRRKDVGKRVLKIQANFREVFELLSSNDRSN